MRRTAARLNRSWLAVLGVVLLLTGLIGLGVSLQLWERLLPGLAISWPTAQNPLLGDAVWLEAAWLPAAAAVVGVVVALLGLLWLMAQVPRREAAKPFRLHDSAGDGYTRLSPEVVTDAVEEQARSIPGVRSASAVLRGTANRPELTMRITVADDADVARLLQGLQTQVVSGVTTALDCDVARLGVVVDVDRATTRAPQAVTL